MKFTEKSFFYTILGISRSHSGPLGYIEGFIQLIQRPSKSDKPTNSTGYETIHMKCDCVNGFIVNGTGTYIV